MQSTNNDSHSDFPLKRMVGKRQEQIKTKQKFTLEKAASTSVNINSGGHVDGTYH